MFDLSPLYIDFSTLEPGEKLLDKFPELSAFPEFKNALNDDEIKIAILTADNESPFGRIKERDIMLNAVFDYLNLPRETAVQKKFFHDIFMYRHERYMDCWIRYIQIIHDTDYTNWLQMQQTYNFLLFESKKQKTEKEDEDKYLDRRLKIQRNLKQIGEDLKELEVKLYPDGKAAREAALRENIKIITIAERYAEESTHI